MADPTYTTELEAVNLMLSAVGQPPVTALGSTNRDAVQAELILDETLKEILLEGWVFNTEEKVTLTPDGGGIVTLPTNTARVDAWDPNNDYVFRNGQLYNREDKTNVFSGDVVVDLTYYLEWTKLPPTARHYIAKSAIRRFSERVLGSSRHSQWARQDEARARVRMVAEEGMNSDRSMIDSPDAYYVQLGRRGVRLWR